MFIILQMSFINFVLLLVLVAASDKHFVHAQRNETISFVCCTLKTNGCQLYKYSHGKTLIVDRSRHTEGRFKIKDSASCIIQIEKLKMYDSGEYHCITDKDYAVYYLDVKGVPSIMVYNKKLWSNNSENFLQPNEQGAVHFRCHSFLQKRANGRTIFMWSLNRKPFRTETFFSKINDDLWESESSVQVLFRQGDKEKEIKCRIQSGSETEILVGKFGIPYFTYKAILLDRSFFKERTILEGDVKKIVCRANGFPMARDFVIKKKVKNKKWEVVSFRSFFKVYESGTYMCEARNTDARGNKMDAYIGSNKLSFRNYG